MNNDKSISMVGELLKQRYHPEQYAQEQEQKKKELAELLSFVDGVLAGLDQAKQAQEATKGKPVFVTDENDPKGFRPNR